VGTAEDALSVCNETVPDGRFVDGIPGYDQCSASQNSAIYSNNGVDTSTSAEGSDWVRTQRSGGYQCTELAHRYLYFRWDVPWIPNGNAGTWCDAQPPSSSGVVQTSTPVHGDVIVFPPGECGADSTYGHVALVDVVDSDTRVTIVEQNRAGRRATNISCAACFLHVVTNDGSPQGSAGATGTGGAPEATGGALTPTGGTSAGTGAAPVSTGGVSFATGGAPADTGGVLNGDGGAAPGTGGVIASSGSSAQSTGGAALGTGGVARGTGGASTLSTGGANSGVGGVVPEAGSASKTGGGANAAGGSGATGADQGATGGSADEDTGDSGAENTVPEATVAEDATDNVAGCSCGVAGSSRRTRSTSTHFAILALAAMVALGRRRSVRRR
jgi:MYXO-CTERM domain-containing protein